MVRTATVWHNALMKIVTPALIDDLILRASRSPRGRMNLNLHEQLSDPINRFVNAGTEGSYVRAHRHQPGRWELMAILRGRARVVTFADDGAITGAYALDAETALAVEIPGACWHTVIFHAPSAAVLEVKPGPYDVKTDKEFAAWAPAEGSREAADFLHSLAAELERRC